MSQAAGQVNILIFLLTIKFPPCMPINFVMQGKYLFSDISRPAYTLYLYATGLQIRAYLICYFLTETHVVGTQKNRLDKTVLFSTQSIMYALTSE